MFNTRVVEPRQLGPESRFNFKCYPGISCFTRCCSNIDIMLTPYDVLRLKRRLGISSHEFLEKYTLVRIDNNTSHPYAYLKMGTDADRLCPFVVVPEGSEKGGCTVYADRPVSCRYYPVGQGTLKKRDDEGKIYHEEFYFFVKESHCAGFKEPMEWTVASWKDDQEITLYDNMNREWKELLMRRNLPNQPELNNKKRGQFFMASYDLDTFREYLFVSRFFDVFDMPEKDIEEMKSSDEALMKFGARYIKFLLGMEETLKVKKGVLEERAKRKE
jgi:Fe-S-cluster containining protein